MKQILIVLSLTLLLASCNNDLCKQTVTYTKATAIYGSMDDVRNQPTNGVATQIENPGKVYVGENYLLIGEENKGIHVIDNSNPENPTEVNFINISGNKEFYVEGNALYAESLTDVVKYNIDNLLDVTVDSRAMNVFEFNNFDQEGNEIIGFDFEVVTEKLDCDAKINAGSTIFYSWNNEIIPASTVPVSFAGSSVGGIGTVNRIAYNNDHLYIINRSQMFTLADNNQLELINKDHAGWRMETLFPYEDHLFIGTETGMLIYSIENSPTPEYFARFDHAQACDPVLPKNGVAYVTLRSGSECQGFTNELDVINISNLASPSLSGVYEIDTPYGMSASGNILYVGQGENGISMYDITDPLMPSLIHQDRAVEAYDIISHPTDNNRILIAGTNGIDQYQIGDDVKDLTLISQIQY